MDWTQLKRSSVWEIYQIRSSMIFLYQIKLKLEFRFNTY